MPDLFRIEKDGIGPYNSFALEEFGLGPANALHPMPCQDELFMTNMMKKRCSASFFLYGFTSIDQLRRWFYRDEWLHALHKKGFTLNVYAVAEEHFCQGHTQAGMVGRPSVKQTISLLEI